MTAAAIPAKELAPRGIVPGTEKRPRGQASLGIRLQLLGRRCPAFKDASERWRLRQHQQLRSLLQKCSLLRRHRHRWQLRRFLPAEGCPPSWNRSGAGGQRRGGEGRSNKHKEGGPKYESFGDVVPWPATDSSLTCAGPCGQCLRGISQPPSLTLPHPIFPRLLSPLRALSLTLLSYSLAIPLPPVSPLSWSPVRRDPGLLLRRMGRGAREDAPRNWRRRPG